MARTLDIALVEDNPNQAKALAQFLKSKLKINHRTQVFCPNKMTIYDDLTKMLNTRWDVALLDLNLSVPGSRGDLSSAGSITGATIARQFSHKFPNSLRIGMSGYSTHSARANYGEDTPEQFDSYFQKPIDTCSLLHSIRKSVFKPIHVGVIGYGDYGRAISRELAKRREVAGVYVWSQRADTSKLPLLQEEISASLFSKLKRVPSLERLCALQPDVIVIASSALRLSEELDIPHSADRHELNLYNNAHVQKFSRELADRGFPGICFYQGNPISGHLMSAQEAGLSPHRVSSIFQPDTNRILNPLGTNPKIASEVEHDAGFIRELQYHVMGIHGEPQIVPSARLRDILGEDFAKVKKFAERYARSIPKKAYRVSRGSSIPHTYPAESIASSICELARFNENPTFNLYTYHKVNTRDEEYRGFIATPAEIDYSHPFPAIQPSTKKINELGFNECYTVENGPQLYSALKTQSEYYREQQRARVFTNARTVLRLRQAASDVNLIKV
jgi:hypothetical protein